MKIAVAGTGYVGLVTGTCLAETGHDVVCVDIDEAKIKVMESGVSPIYEEGLEELMQKNYAAGRIRYTTDYAKAYKEAGLTFCPISDPDKGRTYEKLDIRFVKDGVSVLIETKDDFALPKNRKAADQLSAYVEYEKSLTGNKIVAILANTNNDRIRVYRGAVSDDNILDK